MKKRARYALIPLAMIIAGTLLFSCNIFDSPAAPEKTDISAIFKASNDKIFEGFLVDSVGKEIAIGAALYLPANFDSVTFEVVDSGTTVINSTVRDFKDDYFKDTIWISHTFRTPGVKNVTITPFANPARPPVVSAITITGVLRNEAPQWSVDTLIRTIKVGSQLSQPLTEICTDKEKDDLTFSIIPGTMDNGTIINSTYHFTPSIQHIGTQIVIINASDANGNNSTLPVKITILNSSGDPLSEYKVVYDGNGSIGGTVPVDSNTYTASSTVFIKDNTGLLMKTGATFSGWNTAADGSGTTYVSGATFSMGNANVILYARWTTQLPPFTVTYNGNSHTAGAAPVDTGKYVTGVTVTVKGNTGNMVKVGYTFTGWNTAADGSGTTYVSGVTFPMGSANVTLYAQWTTRTTFTVTYDGNGNTGGTVPSDANNYETTATVTVKENTGLLAKIGSTFTGWNTATDGSGTDYASGVTFPMGSANVTLYAKWTTTPSYSVTFNSNGGSGTMTAQSIVSGMSAPLIANSFIKAGSVFAGWMTTATGTTAEYADKASFTIGADNVTLYALWTQNPSYKITFNSNGGSGIMADQSIVSGMSVPLSENTFTKPGSVFAGWTTSPTGTTIDYTDRAPYTMGENDVTLYALWSQNSLYTITFNSNGGTGTMADQPIVSGMDAPLVANTFTRTGYTFAGWATTPTGAVTYADQADYTMLASPVTLYVVWTQNPSWNVSFNKNNGTGTMDPQPIIQGTTAALTANSFTKTGHIFAGWATTPTSDVAYIDEDNYTMGDGHVTLYAVWTVNNVPPTVSALSIAPNPVNQGASVGFSATTNFGTAYPTAVYRIVKSPYTAATDTIAAGSVASTTINYSIAATYNHQASYKVVVSNSTSTVESAPVALTVRDVTVPVVTLTGSAAVTVNQNSSWTDPGATATDDRDGTKTVVSSGTVNLTVPGTYTVRYTATDNAGNSSYKERTITVVAVWVLLDQKDVDVFRISPFVLGPNEILHYAEPSSDVWEINLYKLNSSGKIVLASAASYHGYSQNGLSLSLGSDNASLFLGCVTGQAYYNGNWHVVDEIGWQNIAGYSMHIGSGNTLYVGAMGSSNYDVRIRRLNSGTWDVVGGDITLPIGFGAIRDQHFCITASQAVYTIGIDFDNPGVSVAYLNGSLWNIVNIESTTEERANGQIIASGNTVFSGFTKPDGVSPVIHQWNGGSRTLLPSMENSPTAKGGFSIACSPSGTLYAAHVENTNVVIKKYDGSSWQVIPGTTTITASSEADIQIVPGTNKCYVIIKTSTEFAIWSLDIN